MHIYVIIHNILYQVRLFLKHVVKYAEKDFTRDESVRMVWAVKLWQCFVGFIWNEFNSLKLR